MAEISPEFKEFLKAYSQDDFNKISSPEFDSAHLTAIFNRFKDTYDLWIKCPQWLRAKYSNHVPEKILSEISKKPNITDFNTIESNTSSSDKNENNALEDFDNTLSSSPLFGELADLGIRLSKDDFAAIKEKAKEIQQKSYSKEAAQNIALNKQYLIATAKAIDDIMAKSDISEEEKSEQIQKLMNARYKIRGKTADVIRTEYNTNRPEHAFIRLARSFNAGKITEKEFEEQSQSLMKKIVDMGHISDLSAELKTPMYGRLKDETKEKLFELGNLYGLNIKELETEVSEVSQNPEIKTKENTSSVIQPYPQRMPTRQADSTSEEIQRIMRLRQQIYQNIIDTAKADMEKNRPEHAFIRLARDFNAGKISKEAFLSKAGPLMKRTIELGRLPQLSEELKSPMYRRLRDNTKKEILRIGISYGIGANTSAAARQMVSNELLSLRQTQKVTLKRELAEMEKNRPEHALVRLTRDLHAGKIDKETFFTKAEPLMKRTIELGRLPQFSEELKGPMYQHLNDGAKNCLLDLTDRYGYHFKASQKLLAKFASKPELKSNISQSNITRSSVSSENMTGRQAQYS